jgi:hypothetical protein
MRAPVLSRAPRLWALPPYLRGLRRYYVPHGTAPCLPAQECSGAATCPATSDPVSLLRRAPSLSRVSWLRTPPPYSGGVRRCHVSRGSQRATCLWNKERHSWPRYVARLTCFQVTLARYQVTCKTCEQATSIWPARHANMTLQYNAGQLTTPGHDYSDDATQQDDTTSLTVFSIAVRQDGTTPRCWRRTRHH